MDIDEVIAYFNTCIEFPVSDVSLERINFEDVDPAMQDLINASNRRKSAVYYRDSDVPFHIYSAGDVGNLWGRQLLSILVSIMLNDEYLVEKGCVLFNVGTTQEFAILIYNDPLRLACASLKSDRREHKYYFQRLFDDDFVMCNRRKYHDDENFSYDTITELRHPLDDVFNQFMLQPISLTDQLNRSALFEVIFDTAVMGIRVLYQASSVTNRELPIPACVKIAMENGRSGKLTAICKPLPKKLQRTLQENFMDEYRDKNNREPAPKLVKTKLEVLISEYKMDIVRELVIS